ncbi:hypothetical protein F5Y13DRAFT_182356 [Hypoxylon sp. FL1857]|nr:hypothetical protein F5Y13DRAFT_182356 [Hypoxylon sp. FL1857]
MPSDCSCGRPRYRARSLSEGPIRRYNFTFDTGFMTDDTNFDLSDSDLDVESLGSSPERKSHSCNTHTRCVQPGRLHRINLPGAGTAHFGINVPDERLPYNEQVPDGNVLPELPREIHTVFTQSGETVRALGPDEHDAATVSVTFDYAHLDNRPNGASALGPLQRRVSGLEAQSGSETETADEPKRISGFRVVRDEIIKEYYEQHEPTFHRLVVTDASQAEAGTQDQENRDGTRDIAIQGPIPIKAIINIDYDPALLDIRGYDVKVTRRSPPAEEEEEDAEGEELQGGQEGERGAFNCRMH